MKIYQSDGGLGYNQLAFLIRLEETKNGYNYLCVDTQNIEPEDDTSYVIGEIVEDLENIYVKESTYKVEESPLYGTFLFNYFLKSQN